MYDDDPSSWSVNNFSDSRDANMSRESSKCHAYIRGATGTLPEMRLDVLGI